MKAIYVCHPYSGDPEGNRVKVRKICRILVGMGVLPVAPQIYLPAFIDEGSEREVAMRMCRELLTRCDAIGICGDEITAGMKEEIELAGSLGMVAGRIELLDEIDGFPMEKAEA